MESLRKVSSASVIRQVIIISEGKVDKENGAFVLKKATVDRTARCLMKIGESTGAKWRD